VSTISGGTTRIAVSFAILMYFSARGAGFGFIVTTGAAVAGIPITVTSVLIAGIDIEIASPRFNEAQPARASGPYWIRLQHV
jgi:hypothetical protein